MLVWGAKGGGKTVRCLREMVEHCRDNENAFGLILTPIVMMARNGGVWDVLLHTVLPEMKQSCGLEYSDEKLDFEHNSQLWIKNIHGKWSLIKLARPPRRNSDFWWRGVEPSMVFADNLTCFDGELLKQAAPRLGRRPMVEGAQKVIGACEPESPEHWVYQTWFVDHYEDPEFSNIYVPVVNPDSEYQRGLRAVYGKNATEAARMIGGKWVA